MMLFELVFFVPSEQEEEDQENCSEDLALGFGTEAVLQRRMISTS
jgi:hypothetical protein